MGYIDPTTVVAPRNRIKSVEVLYDGKDGGWSLARLAFDNDECLGIRWNGTDEEPGIGNPQSHGKPTWFVLPKDLNEDILKRIEELGNSKHAELLSAYREMAADQDREKDALEWSEGLIGDAAN